MSGSSYSSLFRHFICLFVCLRVLYALCLVLFSLSFILIVGLASNVVRFVFRPCFLCIVIFVPIFATTILVGRFLRKKMGDRALFLFFFVLIFLATFASFCLFYV